MQLRMTAVQSLAWELRELVELLAEVGVHRVFSKLGFGIVEAL